MYFEYNGLAHITELAAKKLSNVTVYQNDVLLNITGDSVARTCLVPRDVLPARVNQHVAILRVDSNKLDPRFLCYFLASPNMQNYMLGLAVGKGASRNAMTKTMIGEFDIPYPSMETQKRIADILSAYDDLIENNQKQIKLLEEAAQRLYKEWFIDLHFPGHETTPIVNDIPAGWKYIKIGEILKNMPRTKQIQTAAYHKVGKYPIIDQSKEFIAGYTDDDEAKIDFPYPIIVFGDHTRILKLIQFPFAKGADGTQLIASNHPCMPQYLMYCSLVNVDISNYHYARHFKYLKEEKILVPSKSVTTHFETNVKPIFLLMQNCRNKIWRAMQARDRLLPKLMSGEIEV